MRRRNALVIVGAFGYWAVRQRRAVGDVPRGRRARPLTVILMGYLIGQLGGLLPIPGGIGGIDGGLIGTLDRLRRARGGDGGRGAGLPRDPLLAAADRRRRGVRSLRRGLNQPDRPDLCHVPVRPGDPDRRLPAAETRTLRVAGPG